MSAYLCNPNKIGTLAQAIAAHTTEFGTSTVIAQTLAAENLRSVGCRYGLDAKATAKAFMSTTAIKYTRECRAAALDPMYAPANFSQDALLDIEREYHYQSCECDDWPDTQAAKMLKAITAPIGMLIAA